jgi:ElaB/YqjD/DUF883 family membrane-anchored ribosome-binding protein
MKTTMNTTMNHTMTPTKTDALDAAADEAGRLTDQAGKLAHRGVDALNQASHEVRDRVLKASDDTLNYIRAEPVKATLMAAATGAALMGLVCLMTRPHERR